MGAVLVALSTIFLHCIVIPDQVGVEVQSFKMYLKDAFLLHFNFAFQWETLS